MFERFVLQVDDDHGRDHALDYREVDLYDQGRQRIGIIASHRAERFRRTAEHHEQRRCVSALVERKRRLRSRS